MDKNLEKIIDKVAARTSVTPVKLKSAVDIFFRNAKHLLQREDMPTVFMHGLGKLEPDERRIKRRIILLKKYYLAGNMTQEEYEEAKNKLTAVLESIKNNKQYRTK